MLPEKAYQQELIKRIYERYGRVFVLKNDSSYIQGIPDLGIFLPKTWAWLEVKPYADAPHQPNQDYYVDKAKDMAFGSFIFPENEEEILHGLDEFIKKRS